MAWLLLLLRDSGEAYGYTLHHELRTRGIGLQPGRLYRWLAKFERDGWVVARWSESAAGPRRHIYGITGEGRSALGETQVLIAAMREAYDAFVRAHTGAVARRGDEAGRDAASAAASELATTPDTAAAAPNASPATRPRPLHKELAEGWLLLLLGDRPTYGYELRRALDAQLLHPDPGGMYRMLRRMEADSWIQSRWAKSDGGPKRRNYRLTAVGHAKLDEIAQLVATIRDVHDSFLDAYDHGAGAAQA